ncbi:craniofacial development protein 1 [Planoprotostelium fungivorum]|uniref:Craniofacial development protein 1 n=1 Tax=Planoprotostelium fungivorum TaxID=1890364 RepID=A0A2P6ND40_9EUKA|nr:craniofacial development protein 1 [Planoprotostelium fungivorum]
MSTEDKPIEKKPEEEEDSDEEDDDFAPSYGEDNDADISKELVPEDDDDDEEGSSRKRKAPTGTPAASKIAKVESETDKTEAVRPSTRSTPVAAPLKPVTKAAVPAKKAAAKPQKPTTNLDKLLSNLSGGKKTSTLSKTRNDWEKFKEKEGITDDLRAQTQSGGFLEKQAFLQRADLREFEKEKEIRMSKKK